MKERFFRNRTAVFTVAFVLLVGLVGVLAPVIAPNDPYETNDLTSITYLCDDVLFLYQGRVTENLPVERISETKDEYARKLLESIVVFDTEESA